MEDYETPDDFAEEFEASTRKSKEPKAGKTNKKNKQTKWKPDEIETLIAELEKRSCL